MKQRFLVIIALFVIASVAFYFLNKSGGFIARNQQIVQPDKIIPTNLIPAKSIVQENYEISTDKYQQNTVNLETRDSVKTVYDYYLKTIEKDYTVQRKSYSKDNASIYAYARNDVHELNIVIYKSSKTSKTEVVLSYVNIILK